MLWLPEYGVGVIVLANVTYAGAGTVARGMLEKLAATGAPVCVCREISFLKARGEGLVLALLELARRAWSCTRHPTRP